MESIIEYLKVIVPIIIILAVILKVISWNNKYLMTHINFGKYKGKKWSEVPNDYLLWIINNHSNNEYRKRAKEEIEKSGEFKVVEKNKSNESIGPIYDQDGNISTDEEMNEQLRQAIREYYNNVSSDDYYQKHLEKIKQSKNTTIIEPEGIYFKGKFFANEVVEEQKEIEDYFKAHEKFIDFEEDLMLQEIREEEERERFFEKQNQELIEEYLREQKEQEDLLEYEQRMIEEYEDKIIDDKK